MVKSFSTKPTLFVHSGCRSDNFHLQIYKEFKISIDNSGQKQNVDVRLCTVGNKIDSSDWSDWANINHHDDDYQRTEFFSLGKLQEHCLELVNRGEDTPVGYIQTSGQFHGFTNPCITDRRHYMTYFAVEHMEKCWNALKEGYDVVGVDWQEFPNKHFSGNFWWTRPSYIAKLPNIDPPNFFIQGCPSYRHLAEFWIGFANPTVKCLHQSNINVYERHLHRYPKERYSYDK